MRINWLGSFTVSALMALAVTSINTTTPAQAQGTLRVGMTANDIPLAWGQPDNGFEGFRFVGLQLYDALINFDLTATDRPSTLIPGLAESWTVDDTKTKWTFKLRQGVKFHDGSNPYPLIHRNSASRHRLSKLPTLPSS